MFGNGLRRPGFSISLLGTARRISVRLAPAHVNCFVHALGWRENAGGRVLRKIALSFLLLLLVLLAAHLMFSPPSLEGRAVADAAAELMITGSGA
jgi:hypothetical protein